LRIDDKPRVQEGLKFVETTQQVLIRNRPFFQSIHFTITETMKKLYQNFLLENPEHTISYGTFLALKPVYVRAAGAKDLETCACKKHMHARQSINALIKLCEKELVVLDEIKDYYSFFEHIKKDCGKCKTGHIPWECVAEKNNLCDHIQARWEALSQRILADIEPNTRERFEYFVKVEEVTKKEKTVQRLQAVTTMTNAEYLVEFITKNLAKIQFHRNQLKHYRGTLPILRERFSECTYLLQGKFNLSLK